MTIERNSNSEPGTRNLERIVLLCLISLLLVACGVKGPPRPPVMNSPAADAGVVPDGGE